MASNEVLISNPNVMNALHQLKLETAVELGIPNYDAIYKGDLPSRVNGSVGGYMTKKLVALAQMKLIENQGKLP